MGKILSPIKERLLEFLKFKAISRESFYRITEISPSNFKGIGMCSELGGDKISRILACYRELNPNWLLTGRGQMIVGAASYSDMPDAPAVGVSDVSANYTASPEANDDSIPLYRLDASVGLDAVFRGEKEAVSRMVLPGLPPCDGALYVQGEAMAPLLRSGDIVVYREVRDWSHGVMWGETYLLAFDFDGAVSISIRQILPGSDPDHLVLDSSNPQYPPLEIPLTAIRALALVKASVRYNTMG